MTDMDARGMRWERNIFDTKAIVESQTKNLKEILKTFNRNGAKLIAGDQTAIASWIKNLISLGWIKETKDAYVLTEKGKKEVENYESLRKRGLI